ncbi:MAG TPA: hypothetical protein VFM90_13440 [Cyclobacteriaceae bacterium]|nr:hypothetical protein [Cyclobacteriaceae bacterium]
MKTTQYPQRIQHFVTVLLLISLIASTGCDLFSTEDDEEPLCKGEVVLVRRLHNSVTTPEKISDPFRSCYTIALVEQRDLYMNMGTVLDVSNIYIELAGPPMGSNGAHFYYHTITLSSAGKYFFEASLEDITVSFTHLDANKLPVAGDKLITGFEMLKIDPETREISFAITESALRTGNYTKFVYEPYAMANLVVPENP